MFDDRFANPNPAPKTAYVHPRRADGRHKVTFVFPVSGKRLVKLIPQGELDAKLDGFVRVNVGY